MPYFDDNGVPLNTPNFMVWCIKMTSILLAKAQFLRSYDIHGQAFSFYTSPVAIGQYIFHTFEIIE